MRENALDNRTLSTSLFNFVLTEDVRSALKNNEIVKGAQNRLAKIIIDLARPLTRKHSVVERLQLVG